MKASEEFDITVGDYENVTSRTLVNYLRYTYDSEGNLVARFTPSAYGTEYYQHPEEGDPVLTFYSGIQRVISHSKSDGFGRKVFDELQLGTRFVSRRYDYVVGDVTDEHINGEKLKSSPTTNLVSRITYADGRTIEYEYDKEERITKVTETRKQGEETLTDITEYTYDALGQLLTETVNGVVVNTMTYDNYGNILTKNGVTYGYDSTWKDLLTSYNGDTIEYDEQGNPTKYLGYELAWEKGRQLASIEKKENGETVFATSYSYNANGIRTSKTVNGVRHDYYLDGTKILYEGWNWNATTGEYASFLAPIYDSEDSVCGIVYCAATYYFLKNQQGDVIAITNKDGEVVCRYTYDAWGKVTSITGSLTVMGQVNPFRYRGYYYDRETGLYYLQSRYYDPETGRFVNADEVSYTISSCLPSATNAYSYCENDCINAYDLFGYASFRTKNSNLNNLIETLEKVIPNIYTDDIKKKEVTLLRVGHSNLSLTISCGIAFQTNKNAIFGGLFKKGTLEVSTFFGVNSFVCLGFSAGISWSKAYIKLGLMLAMSKIRTGLYGGVYVEISVPTWLLAVATVVVGIVSFYAPAIGAYIVKIISTIRTSLRVAAPILVPLLPRLAKLTAM